MMRSDKWKYANVIKSLTQNEKAIEVYDKYKRVFYDEHLKNYLIKNF
jgi:hypothetical protein